MTASSEFVSEAQEIVETFSRQLLAIEQDLREGRDHDPDVLNAAFRSVHTLKGLAGLGGGGDIETLSHALENTLDALRLGKLPFGQTTLDVLFEAVDLFAALLAKSADDGAPGVDISQFVVRLDSLSVPGPEASSVDPLSWLDDNILGVLTEYEEHRLRENVRQGRSIFRVHASFDLLAIDVGIEALKQKMKAYGEVITYLPSADSAADDRIELDILLGSKASLSEIAAGVADAGVIVEELGREGERSERRRRASTGSFDDSPPSDPASRAAAPLVDEEPEPTSVRSRPIVEPEPAAPEESEDPQSNLSLRSLSQTVRVDLRRLDGLMNLVGELGVVQANLGDLLGRMTESVEAKDVAREFSDQLRTMSRRLNLLQQGILEVRMVPLGQVFDKLARVVRKLGRDAAKDVRLGISGAQTELDKLIVEELSDPLMHMVRNAIDHGIEPAEERVALGKQAAGQLDLRAHQKGNRVVIELEDDGRGMDWELIRDIAVQRGFISREDAANLTPRQALNLIFSPGFSTRTRATELSGRGVGMDVVKTNISRLSGMIDVDSEPGRGSRFRITLPVTLAIIQALVIETAGETFCIPLNSVLESIMVQRSEIQTIEGHEVVSLRGRTLPLLELARVFDLREQTTESSRLYVVVVGLAQHRVGLVVDELLGQQDVVIKPVGRALRQVPGIAGATELGANRTVLLLDVATLVSEAVGGVEAVTAGLGGEGEREGVHG